MVWFGSGVNHEPYDKDGNPQTTGHESAAIVQSFGTNDLDHVLAAYAPGLIHSMKEQMKGIQCTYDAVKNMNKIIEQQNEQIAKQNQQIDELTKKLNALER